MPACLAEEPLGIACVFSDGSRAEFGLDGLPAPRLAQDLLVGLVELVHPHGSVDAAGTVGTTCWRCATWSGRWLCGDLPAAPAI
jgi:hypothetical protein